MDSRRVSNVPVKRCLQQVAQVSGVACAIRDSRDLKADSRAWQMHLAQRVLLDRINSRRVPHYVHHAGLGYTKRPSGQERAWLVRRTRQQGSGATHR